MKKKLGLILLTFVSLLFCTSIAKAEGDSNLTGDPASASTNGGQCESNFAGFCGNNPSGLYVRLLYIDGGVIVRQYAAGFYGSGTGFSTGSDPEGRGIAISRVGSIAGMIQGRGYNIGAIKSTFQMNDLNSGTGELASLLASSPSSGYHGGSVQDWLKNQCLSMGMSDLRECTSLTGGSKGFRIMVEPVISGKCRGSAVSGTIKKLHQRFGGYSNPCRRAEYPYLIYLERADVGIMNPAPKSTSIAACEAEYKRVKSYSKAADNVGAPTFDMIGNDTYGLGMGLFTWTSNGEILCEGLGCNPTCDYHIDYNIPSTCDASNGGFIKDMTNWKCIFKSDEQSTPIKTHYASSPKVNQFCSVYCRDEIYWNYPTSISINQGRVMTINDPHANAVNVSPIQYRGDRFCRVTSKNAENKAGQIDHNLFVTLLNTANQNIRNAWRAREQAMVNYMAADKYRNLERGGCGPGKPSSYSVSEYTDCQNSNAAKKSAYDNCQSGVAACKQRNAAKAGKKGAVLENCGSCSAPGYEDCSGRCDGTKYTTSGNHPCASDHQSASYGSYSSNTPRWSCNFWVVSGHTDHNGNRCTAITDQNYSKGISSCDGSLQAFINGYKNAYISADTTYRNALIARENLLAQYELCTSYPTTGNDTMKFREFQPTLDFGYKEPVYGNSFSLKSDPSSPNPDLGATYYSSGSAITGTGSVSELQQKDFANVTCYDGGDCSVGVSRDSNNTYGGCTTNCSENTASPAVYKIGSWSYRNRAKLPYSVWWETKSHSEFTYKLAGSLFRYTSREDGLASHSIPSALYDDIGFTNLPIHYSTMPGSYEYSINTYTYGPGNKFDRYFINGNTPTRFGVNSYSGDGIYKCHFDVNCEDIISIKKSKCGAYTNVCGSNSWANICSPFVVIYRTISMYSKEAAFPGIDARKTSNDSGGRGPGANWNNTNTINTYILNNRGVANYSVYNLTPMYEITLTPGMMKLFRKYNKEMNSKVVTIYSKSDEGISGYDSYENFYQVNAATGKRTLSSLIRGNVAGYNDIKVTGCGIAGQSTGNCGNTQAW